MSDPSLDALARLATAAQAMLGAATPGPWRVEHGRTFDTTTGAVASVEAFVRRPDDDVAIAADIVDPATGSGVIHPESHHPAGTAAKSNHLTPGSQRRRLTHPQSRQGAEFAVSGAARTRRYLSRCETDNAASALPPRGERT